MSTILIVAASGRTSGSVINALLKDNQSGGIQGQGGNMQGSVPLRLLTRSDNSKADLEALYGEQGVEVYIGDLTNRASLLQAMQGVNTVFYNAPTFDPLEHAMGINAISAAQESNITHFVYVSVLHPFRTRLPHYKEKLAVEEYLSESRLDYTVLQPARYMQNIPIARILEDANYNWTIPHSPQTLLGYISLEDFAEIAAKILRDPTSHKGARYELVGENGSYSEVANILTKVLGRAISCEKDPNQVTGNEWKDKIKQTADLQYDCWSLSGNPNILRWLLGRNPTNLEKYVRKTAIHTRNQRHQSG